MEQLLGGFLVVLLFSAFVKILTTLSILRYSLGLNSAAMGLVFVGVSLALSLFVMEANGIFGFEVFSNKTNISQENINKVKPFLEKHSEPQTLSKLKDLRQKLKPEATESSDSTLLLGFLLTELKEAFGIGFVILIPFLLIDLLVTNVLLALGVTQISSVIASLPLKLLLFISVNGWQMISEKLINTYINQ